MPYPGPSQGARGSGEARPSQQRSRSSILYPLAICAIIILALVATWRILEPGPIPEKNPCVHEGDPGIVILEVEIERNADNWTLVSKCAIPFWPLWEIYLTLYNTSDEVIEQVNHTSLWNITSPNPHEVIGVIYLRVGQSDYIQKGDRIVVSRTAHPSAMRYRIDSAVNPLCGGYF